jgi:phage shock protein C
MQSFALDRSNSKLMGVCAGIARATGADVTLVRVATLLGLFLVGPIALILYLVTGWVAPARV